MPFLPSKSNNAIAKSARTLAKSAGTLPARTARSYRTRQQSRRCGAAVVEFAIVVPVFFLLVFGIVEFGRMVMVQQIITNAAREGARTAALASSTTSQVQNAVNSYLAGVSITGASVAVTPDPPSSATYGSLVTVRVSIPFTRVSWLPAPFFLGSATLQANCVMRTEQPKSGGA